MDNKSTGKENLNSWRMKALQAFQKAGYKLVRERRKTDDSIVSWKDGKVVNIPAKDIPLPEDKK